MSGSMFVIRLVIVSGLLWGQVSCSSGDTSANPVTTAAVDTQDFADYLGKYPFDDSEGIPFLDHPGVRQAVRLAVPDEAIQALVLDSGSGPMTPIFDISEAGDRSRIASWGCEAHNCGPHNWTIMINRDGSDPEVCYHYPDGYEEGSRWFRPGHAPVTGEFQCPGE